MARATETCSCGASITAEDQWTTNLEKRLATWRATHLHQETRSAGFDNPAPFPRVPVDGR